MLKSIKQTLTNIATFVIFMAIAIAFGAIAILVAYSSIFWAIRYAIVAVSGIVATIAFLCTLVPSWGK